MERLRVDPSSSHQNAHEHLRGVAVRAAQVLAHGGLIVYPTDTLYGLGADATNPDAVHRLRIVKGRSAGHAVLALVSHMTMLSAYAEVTPLARVLAKRFLPGALSLVLTPKDERLSHLASADGGVGFRMPAHPLALRIAQTLGRPITSTSVNRTGEPALTDVASLHAAFGENSKHIDLIVDAGTLPTSLPSTLIDARGERAIVLREGAISRDLLAAFL